MDSMEKCHITDEMHERDEPPKMQIMLNTPSNTTVVFDLRKLRWIHLVNELMLW
eukprot:CAMPEP_0197056222 /NCGR_PEP_ID=MMETSP1384-20130603/80906_1 /TAXON_ID=29189 /ORGANISM="Ammonia sp." /LENGTH=53 /DNA_ID=CAMNT_0042490119 /DNA_START=69 /DNA_END=227 /DNA_ORIENTATION=+